jgi:phosphoenolpyruvate carboxylase
MSAPDRSASAGLGLPSELRRLVSDAVAVLGQVVRSAEGDAVYKKIERVRQDMANLRDADERRAQATLTKHLERFRAKRASERFAFAHAFSLMLELMNACENAYRTHRLRQYPSPPADHKPRAVVYVLTAHPTEARSPRAIAVFHEIQATLVRALEQGFERHEATLRHLLALAWHVGSARRRRPRVEDEAEHLYSIVLRDETLGALLDASRELVPVYVRTWVGGDKDGHPGVDEVRMRNSLRLSRARLVRYAEGLLADVRRAASLSPRSFGKLDPMVVRLAKSLSALRALGHGDGAKAAKLRAAIRALRDAYTKIVGALHPSLAKLESLTRMFPALVVPLELREASDVLIRSAAGEPSAIDRMLAELARIARGGDPRWYARGLIISMVSSFEHVQAAASLVKRELGGIRIQVIPLFEQRGALEGASAVVNAMLEDKALRAAVDEHWHGYFEVMLGYSDSAKEAGVLASRLAIAEAVAELDRILRRHKVTPLFFHGSGGSVDRGGGSIQEQTAWWPRSALEVYKATLQGEMVERSLASPEIARGRLARIVEAAADAPKAPRRAGSSPAVRAFADRASAMYKKTIATPSFLTVVQRATAYRYLSVLRLGSRPTKRGPVVSVASLRAIPWVLCWTQVRVLFQTWWGVGTAWHALGASDRAKLLAAYEEDPVFRSFVKNLGFTLAKVELPVFGTYLRESGIDPELAKATLKDLATELRAAQAFVRAMSQSRDLLWFRPWLGTSIRLRSPMIHPLNLLQIVALEEDDARLIRETVAGVASGMLTTG